MALLSERMLDTYKTGASGYRKSSILLARPGTFWEWASPRHPPISALKRLGLQLQAGMASFACLFLNTYSRNWTSVFIPAKQRLCELSYLPSLLIVIFRYDLFVIIINISEIYNFIYFVVLLKDLNPNSSTQVHFILLVVINLPLFAFSLIAMKCVYFLLNHLKTCNVKMSHGTKQRS